MRSDFIFKILAGGKPFPITDSLYDDFIKSEIKNPIHLPIILFLQTFLGNSKNFMKKFIPYINGFVIFCTDSFTPCLCEKDTIGIAAFYLIIKPFPEFMRGTNYMIDPVTIDP